MNIPWLGPNDPLPPVERALRRPNGLLAAGGGLAVSRLLEAYSRGCFPWFNEGEPVLWWSPDPRMILVPGELHVSRSLLKRIRHGGFTVRADTAFRQVMTGCAAPRPGQSGTWITDEMIAAYGALHDAGAAHSIETWMDGDLVGGLYGVAIGRAFFGESMFARVTDASKLAFVHLVAQLQQWEFGVVDCQMNTSHLAAFGAREIPRTSFLALIRAQIARNAPPVPWQLDARVSDRLLSRQAHAG
jgi:leucyl/phenylalanyl-tRNA---protein transferase